MSESSFGFIFGKVLKTAEQNETFDEIDEAMETDDPIAFFEEKKVKLNKKLFLKLIEKGEWNFVIENIEKFKGLVLNKEIALELIDARDGYYVVSNIEMFKGLILNKDIALRYIATKQEWIVVDYLNKFKGLDKEVALELIKKGKAGFVIDNIENFKGLLSEGQKDVALVIAGNEYGATYLAKNFEKLLALSSEGQKEVALAIASNGGRKELAKSFEKLSVLSSEGQKEVALAIIGNGNTSARGDGSFSDLFLINENRDTVNALVNNFEKLSKIKDIDDCSEVVLAILEMNSGEIIINNKDKFGKLNSNVNFYLSRGLDGVDCKNIQEIYEDIKDLSFTEQNKKISEKIKPNLDQQVLENWNAIENIVGLDIIFKFKENNFNSWHDILLFAAHIRKKSLEKVFDKKILKNIILTAPDNNSLDQIFNQFSVDVWQEGLDKLEKKDFKFNFAKLRNYELRNHKEFKKYLDIIKLAGIFPEGLNSEEIQNVQIMLEAPGVSLAVIKKKLENGSLQKMMHNEQLDRDALIQAIEKEYSIVGLNAIVKSALQGKERGKVANDFGRLVKKDRNKIEIDREEINFNLLDYIRHLDKKTKTEIKSSYAKEISAVYNNEKLDDANQDKQKIKLQEAEKKEVQKSLILLQGGKNLNLANLKIDLDNFEIFSKYLEVILTDEKNKKIRGYLVKQGFVNPDLEDEAVVKDMLQDILDLGMRGNQAVGNAKKMYAELNKYVGNHYNGLNTRDYLFKEIPEKDKKYIQELLDKYNVRIKGKKLVARIHKKTDPKAWVSGDYTECCMRYGTEKNDDYMNNKSTAYFTISLEDDRGNSDMIAQSVLVAAINEGEDESDYLSKEKDYNTLAIDNIEIANRGIRFRPQIAKIYKDIFNNNFADKKILMGTSYNDDGGLVSGDLESIKMNYKPLEELEYTDCFDHSQCYLFRNSKNTEKKNDIKLKGLVSYALEENTAFVKELKEKMGEENFMAVKQQLLVYNQGIPDGGNDGGMLFPNNYSNVFESRDGEMEGYIVAGELLDKDDDVDDDVKVEKIIFWTDDIDKQNEYLEKWIVNREEGVDLWFKKEALSVELLNHLQEPVVLAETYIIKEKEGYLILESLVEEEDDYDYDEAYDYNDEYDENYR